MNALTCLLPRQAQHNSIKFMHQKKQQERYPGFKLQILFYARSRGISKKAYMRFDTACSSAQPKGSSETVTNIVRPEPVEGQLPVFFASTSSRKN